MINSGLIPDEIAADLIGGLDLTGKGEKVERIIVKAQQAARTSSNFLIDSQEKTVALVSPAYE
jgi:hypothetical protein